MSGAPLLLVCVLCAVCPPGSYACSSTWTGSTCQICRAFADGLIYHYNQGTVSYSNVVSRCNTELSRTYGNCQYNSHCANYYASSYADMASDLESNPSATAADLCSSVCSSVSKVQLSTNNDAELQQRVGSKKKFFEVLMSEMRDAGTTALQEECNKCKSVAYAVSVTLGDIQALLDDNQNNIESAYVSTAAFTRCLVEWSDGNKPLWHQGCRCKTLVYDLFNAPLMRPDDPPIETICESIGRCPRCGKENLLDILSIKRGPKLNME